MVKRRYVGDGQLELFTIAAHSSDIRAKNVRELMSWGMFNISNRHKLALEHSQGDKWMKIEANAGKSIASQHDNDILIFLTSHLVNSLNMGEKVGPRMFFTANEFFRFTRREHVGGTRYTQIWDMLYRLNDTFVHTNIDIGNGQRVESRWNWLPEIHRKTNNISGKVIGFEVVIASAIFDAINQSTPAVLTLDPRYFDFRSGFQKFLYMFARRSAGMDHEWIVTEKMLHARSGSSLILSQWRKLLTEVYDSGELADYKIKKAMIGKEKAVAFERNKYSASKVHRTTITME